MLTNVKIMETRAREMTPFFANGWAACSSRFGPDWDADMNTLIGKAFGPPSSWDGPLEAYAEFAMDSLRSQKHFEKTGRYEHQKLSDVSPLLENEEFMMGNYLPGLLLSHFLWPHHYELLKFFRNEVLNSLPPITSFYDLGTGTGLYSVEILKKFPGARGVGVDISNHSAEFTRRLVAAFNASGRYRMETANLFEWSPPGGGADFVVNQEVLEHLEEPEKFLEALFACVRPGGRAYITAAINAAHPDHIYLFRSPEDVEQMLKNVGFKPLKKRAVLAYEGKDKKTTPCVAGYLCERPL